MCISKDIIWGSLYREPYIFLISARWSVFWYSKICNGIWEKQNLCAFYILCANFITFNKGVSKTLLNIEDGAFCIKSVNYFRKTLHHRYLTGFWIRLCLNEVIFSDDFTLSESSGLTPLDSNSNNKLFLAFPKGYTLIQLFWVSHLIKVFIFLCRDSFALHE